MLFTADSGAGLAGTVSEMAADCAEEKDHRDQRDENVLIRLLVSGSCGKAKESECEDRRDPHQHGKRNIFLMILLQLAGVLYDFSHLFVPPIVILSGLPLFIVIRVTFFSGGSL